jgi:hypothetical protein
VTNCIYCGRFFNPRNGQGDHVLSARIFGEFEGDKRFRGQCPACNNAFGCHEQVLAQSSQIGFYRGLAMPNLGKRANRGGLTQKGAHGSPRPKLVMLGADSTVLVRPTADNPLDAHPVDHLILRDATGQEHHVELFAKMHPEQLQDQLRRRGLLSATPIGISSPWETRGDFQRLVTGVFPNIKRIGDIRMDPGSYQFHGRAEFNFSISYWQALAKIAFHYYLPRNHRGFAGSEEAFRPIRHFIRHGGDPRDFFKRPDIPFIVPFGPDGPGTVHCPKNWCHLVAANDSGTGVFVYLQFFVGPGSVPPPTYVALGNSDSGLDRGGVWGHLYQQDDDGKGRFAGSVAPVSISPRPITVGATRVLHAREP